MPAQGISPHFLEEIHMDEWSEQQPGIGGGTSDSPALASYDGKLYAAWKGVGDDARMFFSSFDGSQWSPQQPGIGGGTSSSPSLARFDNLGDEFLWAAWKGVQGDNRMFFSSLQGSPILR
jgi:hypothetical protein